MYRPSRQSSLSAVCILRSYPRLVENIMGATMRVLSIIAIIVSAFGCASSPQPEAALFSYDSKEMGRDDLPEAMRHKLFNVQVKYYQDAMQIIRDSVIEIY